jgi:WD40 repeat protein
MMSITFRCPVCSRKYTVEDRFALKRTRCKECGEPLLVPQGIPGPSDSGALPSQPAGSAHNLPASTAAPSVNPHPISSLGAANLETHHCPKTVPLDDIPKKPLFSFPVPAASAGQDVGKVLLFSPQGNYVAAAGGNVVQIVDLSTRKPLAEKTWPGKWLGRDNISCMDISPDGRHLATGSKDGSLRFWAIDEREPRWTVQAHPAVVTFLVFLRHLNLLASVGAEGAVHFWKPVSGQQETTLPSSGHGILAVQPWADGKYLVAWSKNMARPFESSVIGWDTTTGVMETLLEWQSLVSLRDPGIFFDQIENSQPFATAFSAAGHVALGGGLKPASAAFGRIRAGDCMVCNVRTGTTFRGITSQGTIVDLAFSPDSRMLANCNMYGTIDLWQVLNTEVKKIRTLGTACGALTFSPDARLLAAGGRGLTSNPGVKVWEVSTGKELLAADNPSGLQLGFSPDGTFIAALGSPSDNFFGKGYAHVWQVARRA